MHFSQLYSSIAFCKVCFEACRIWSPFFSCWSLLLSANVLTDNHQLKTGPCWKMWNQNGWLKPPAFDRIKNFNHHDLTAKHCYFGCSRLLMGSKPLIKITRLQNIKMKNNVLCLVIFIQNFWSHLHQETLNTQNNNVLQWGHDDLILSKQEALATNCNFNFTSFSTRPC